MNKDTQCEVMGPSIKERKTSYSIKYGDEFKNIGEEYEIRKVIEVLTVLGHKEFNIKVN